MRAIDTNILLRLILEDESVQVGVAATLLDDCARSGETLLVADVVLAELTWFLERGERMSRPQVASILRGLLSNAGLAFEHRNDVVKALNHYAHGRPPAGFADALIVVRTARAGSTGFYTFDKGMKMLPGVIVLPVGEQAKED